ncbi:DUF2460 domain-containing protein [Anaplasma capra]|nr:DUF2460 domain-containing protein [Anaplasma capra]
MPDREAKFPENISYGSVGGPAFSTSVSELSDGREQRKVNWAHPRGRYNVIYSTKSSEQFATLVSFFHAHRGRATPFRFKDWFDYKATWQDIGVGDGQTSDFCLVKRYQAGKHSYLRRISRPVIDSVRVRLNNALQQCNRDYEITPNGMVKFAKPPAHAEVVYADFEFDVLVRFDTDFLACSLDGHGSYGCRSIPLIEVRN